MHVCAPFGCRDADVKPTQIRCTPSVNQAVIDSGVDQEVGLIGVNQDSPEFPRPPAQMLLRRAKDGVNQA
jgi:hypothetical protein